jgi:hypothetical protein
LQSPMLAPQNPLKRYIRTELSTLGLYFTLVTSEARNFYRTSIAPPCYLWAGITLLNKWVFSSLPQIEWGKPAHGVNGGVPRPGMG